MEYIPENIDITSKKSNICPKAVVNLSAIRENYLTILSIVKDKSKCSAVVKNDAYGIGARKVSVCLYEAGCRDFFVAYMSEAFDIRKVLPRDANVYFLQGFDEYYIDEIKNYSIIPVINSVREFYFAKNKNLEMILHVDTGLSRLGIHENEIDSILPDIEKENIKYVISHLACSDEKTHPLNEIQRNNFNKILEKIKTVKSDIKSGISASAGTFLGESYFYDIVRIGAFLYGINPSNSTNTPLPKNVLSLNTCVLQKYEIEKNVPVGYGATFVSNRKTKLAVISIGYADGIKRNLSNRGYIMFYDENKKVYKAPISGTISMDLLVCDVSDIPDNLTDAHKIAHVLDDNYTVNDMAMDSRMIPYEILTSINFKSQRFNLEYVY